jgi:nitrilase
MPNVHHTIHFKLSDHTSDEVVQTIVQDLQALSGVKQSDFSAYRLHENSLVNCRLQITFNADAIASDSQAYQQQINALKACCSYSNDVYNMTDNINFQALLAGGVNAVQRGAREFRSAVVQDHTVFKKDGTLCADVEATVAKFGFYLQCAVSAGVAIITFPELFIGGYPRLLSFGDVGRRTQAHRERYAQYHQNAIIVPDVGGWIPGLSEQVKSAAMVVTVGILEKEVGRDDAALYNTLVIFNANGTVAQKRRKLRPTSDEQNIHSRGTQLPSAIELQLPNGAGGGVDIKIGGVICWEARMAELTSLIALQGMNYTVIPTADGRESGPMDAVAIARRAGFVAFSNQYGIAGEVYGEQFVQDNQVQLNINVTDELYSGRSCIVDPNGFFEAEPLVGQKGLLVATTNMKKMAAKAIDYDARSPEGVYAPPVDLLWELLRARMSTNPVAQVALEVAYTVFTLFDSPAWSAYATRAYGYLLEALMAARHQPVSHLSQPSTLGHFSSPVLPSVAAAEAPQP